MKQFLFVLTFLCQFMAASQEQKSNSYDIKERKGKLFFSLGTEYRITPFYKSSGGQNILPVNIDSQSSGVAFNYTFDYFAAKNLSFGFSNSIRYDLVTTGLTQFTTENGFLPVKNDLIFGFHFYADYHFKIFKNAELYLRIGKSLLNRGTEFSRKQTLYDQNGQPTVSFTSPTVDTAFEPWNFGIGYKKKKISLTLGVYTSSISEYFNDGTTIGIPYINFKYNLGKL